MAMPKDDVIEIANGFLALLCKKHDVRGAFLFGSFAKGTAKDYNDMDLAIALGSRDISEEPPFDGSFKIFHEAQKYNSMLEVVCFVQEEFDQGGGVLVRHIKKEGIKLI